MRFRILLLTLCFLPGFCLYSQQYSVTEELKFTQYLIDNGQYRDAIYILKKQNTSLQNPAVADSMNYFLGWCYYNLKILDSSEILFSDVKQAPLYKKSAFYAMFNQAYQKKTKEAKKSCENIITENDSSLNKLINFEFAGIALLERNYQEYEVRSKKFSGTYFPIAQEEKNFASYYLQLKKLKRKSPAVAGIMSAIIPGSGKFYAGYKGQAAAALMMVGILGAATAESYFRPFGNTEKKGFKSPEFITFGSLFTIFYIGNIWGSTLSVKLAREHQLREINDQILFDMHIPIRRVFN